MQSWPTSSCGNLERICFNLLILPTKRLLCFFLFIPMRLEHLVFSRFSSGLCSVLFRSLLAKLSYTLHVASAAQLSLNAILFNAPAGYSSIPLICIMNVGLFSISYKISQACSIHLNLVPVGTSTLSFLNIL